MKATAHGVIGRGIKECYVNDDNILIFVMTDGKEIPIGFTGELKGIVPIELGGTNAKTANEARSNLGITPTNIGAATSTELEIERKRIDNLSSLKDGSTTGDAELTDIRVDYNGHTHSTAGNAVRSQVRELKSDLVNVGKVLNESINALHTDGVYEYAVNWISGGYIGNNSVSDTEVNGAIIPYNNWSYSESIPVIAGSEVIVKSDTTSGYRQNAFYNADGEYVGELKFNSISIVPDNAVTLRISKRNDSNAQVFVYLEKLSDITSAVASNKEILEMLSSADTPVDYEWIENEYVDTGNNGVFVEYAGWKRTDYIPVSPGEIVRIVASATSSTQVFNAFYKSNKQYIGKFLVNNTVDSITVPANARYYALSTSNRNTVKYIKSECSIPGAKEKLGIDALTTKVENIDALTTKVENIDARVDVLEGRKTASYTWSGNLSSGEDIDTNLGYAPKIGLKFGFYGEFDYFDSVKIQLDAYSPNCIIVDSTNVTLKSRFMEDVVLAHGISISGHIQINAICNNPSTVSVTIASNGLQNTVTGNFSVTAYETFHLINGNTELRNCLFTFGVKGIKNDIWAIGDSYFGAKYPARWVYWMFKNGYGEHTLFCGSTGSGAAEADLWIRSLFTHGMPKMLIWAHGMNYESDTESAPASVWLSRTEELISRCNKAGVEIILCTIPSVPIKNHEKKNEYVRNSGYRYIDFAKAVGANSSGEWYDGMLASDRVHPSETGAIALYNMAVATIPELTY